MNLSKPNKEISYLTENGLSFSKLESDITRK
jgi:hypothetical protein